MTVAQPVIITRGDTFDYFDWLTVAPALKDEDDAAREEIHKELFEIGTKSMDSMTPDYCQSKSFHGYYLSYLGGHSPHIFTEDSDQIIKSMRDRNFKVFIGVLTDEPVADWNPDALIAMFRSLVDELGIWDKPQRDPDLKHPILCDSTNYTPMSKEVIRNIDFLLMAYSSDTDWVNLGPGRLYGELGHQMNDALSYVRWLQDACRIEETLHFRLSSGRDLEKKENWYCISFVPDGLKDRTIIFAGYRYEGTIISDDGLKEAVLSTVNPSGADMMSREEQNTMFIPRYEDAALREWFESVENDDVVALKEQSLVDIKPDAQYTYSRGLWFNRGGNRYLLRQVMKMRVLLNEYYGSSSNADPNLENDLENQSEKNEKIHFVLIGNPTNFDVESERWIISVRKNEHGEDVFLCFRKESLHSVGTAYSGDIIAIPSDTVMDHILGECESLVPDIDFEFSYWASDIFRAIEDKEEFSSRREKTVEEVIDIGIKNMKMSALHLDSDYYLFFDTALFDESIRRRALKILNSSKKKRRSYTSDSKDPENRELADLTAHQSDSRLSHDEYTAKDTPSPSHDRDNSGTSSLFGRLFSKLFCVQDKKQQ